MTKTASAWLRFGLGIGLYLLILPLLVLTFILKTLTGAGLATVEPLKARADDLLRGA
jgi:hypothetical protein